MCEVKRIKSAELFPVIKEVLEGGSRVWITVTGMSMYPFLREDTDCVELSQVSINTIKKGDIVLIQRVTGEYILHRVLRKEKEKFFIVGDAQQWIEGPLKSEQLIAVVTAVKRKKHQISCQSMLWRILVGLWINIIPLRHIILKGVRVLTKVKNFKNVIRHGQ